MGKCVAKIKPPTIGTTCSLLRAILYHLVQIFIIVDSIDLTALRTTAVVTFPNEVTLKKTSA